MLFMGSALACSLFCTIVTVPVYCTVFQIVLMFELTKLNHLLCLSFLGIQDKQCLETYSFWWVHISVSGRNNEQRLNYSKTYMLKLKQQPRTEISFKQKFILWHYHLSDCCVFHCFKEENRLQHTYNRKKLTHMRVNTKPLSNHTLAIWRQSKCPPINRTLSMHSSVSLQGTGEQL